MPAGTIELDVDGRTVHARAGQSVAAALHESGRAALTVSSKYHRSRGIHCAAGRCPGCLLEIDGQPNVRSCMVEAKPGMRVRSELHPVRAALLRAIDFTGPLFPLGFQYRYFKRPEWAYRIWEAQLRRTACHTAMPHARPAPVPARRVEADLAVVGAGPAGLGAASAATEEGLRVVLVSRGFAVGGAAKPLDGAVPALARAAGVVAGDGVVLLRRAAALAQFGDVLLVDQGGAPVEVHAPRTVLATGCYERPLRFDGNDLPGVMLASAGRRLLVEQRTLPGRRVVIATEDDAAYALVAPLLAVGARVLAVLDARPAPVAARARSAAGAAAGVRFEAGTRLCRAKGVRRVSGVEATLAGGAVLRLPCDAVLTSGGWQAADELRFAATSRGRIVLEGERAAPLDWGAPAAEADPLLAGAGAVVGARTAVEALWQGRIVGLHAARRHGRDVEAALAEARASLATAGGAR